MRKELIRPDRPTLPGDDGFRFGHALIRDAAYEALPKRQRATLHERYGRWLVSRLGDEAPDEIVGYHLEQAHRYRTELGSADPALGEEAAERLAAAERGARSRGDVAAAVNLLGRAEKLVPRGPARGRLLAALGEALADSAEPAKARAALEEATQSPARPATLTWNGCRASCSPASASARSPRGCGGGVRRRARGDRGS